MNQKQQNVNQIKSDLNSNSSEKLDNNWDNNKPIDDYNRNTKTNTKNYSNNYRKHNNYYNYCDHYYYNTNRYTNRHSDGNRRHDRNRKFPNDIETKRNDKTFKRHETNDKYREKSSNQRQTKTDSKYDKSDRNLDKKTIDNNLHLKLDEITALKSIFDENILKIDENELKGRFLAEPVLSPNKLIVCYKINENRFRRSEKSNSDEKSKTEEFIVEHLPPIELYFELPDDYPSKSHPKFLISCKWLNINELEKICNKLENLWKETKMEVLFTWFSFLQNEVMNYLNKSERLDISSLINLKPKWVTKSESDPNSSQSTSSTTLSKSSLGSRSSNRLVIKLNPSKYRGGALFDKRAVCDLIGLDLINHLKAYNDYKLKETFNKSYIMCNICFTSNLGEDCVVFPCNHINCKTCVRNYFTTLVKEGTVNSLKCPETECQTSAPPNLVRELISEDLFKKYDELLLESVIGSMSDVYYCPRKACGSIVIGESDSSLAHCSTCEYAFCKNCKFSYHGSDPCNMFRDAEQRKLITERYRDANVNEKLELEKLYGKKQLMSALEEAATDKWMEEMSKRCPHCKASIEKSDGCNKMSCWRCNTLFCWLCLQQLPLTQPYSHFNDPNSKCHNQLFRGVNIDFDDIFEDFII